MHTAADQKLSFKMEDIKLLSVKNIFPENVTILETVLVTVLGISAMLVSSGIQLRLYFLLKAKGDQGINLMIQTHQVILSIPECNRLFFNVLILGHVPVDLPTCECISDPFNPIKPCWRSDWTFGLPSGRLPPKIQFCLLQLQIFLHSPF